MGNAFATEAAAFWHHSRILSDRAPQGALSAGESVLLYLNLDESLRGAAQSARLRVWMKEQELMLPGVLEEGETGLRVAFTLTMPDQPGLVWYYFFLDIDGRRRYYGGSSGIGAPSDDLPEAYQITVYDGGFQTPEWFRKSIVYQIFPDRFRRDGLRGGLDRVRKHTEAGRRATAQEDWDETPLYRPLPGATEYEPCDYFGGTLEGIREGLAYLKSLGVGTIYLNPIFEAASNHRYNTANYRRIDPVLGTEEDLVRLVREARSQGIRLMLDGVFSHTGDDSVYFDRYDRYGAPGAYISKDSPYFGWYTFLHWPDRYLSWWGFPTLPEVRELAPDYVDFIAGKEDSLLAYWAARGCTSWRLDVADELPDEFIRFIRTRLKEIDPESVLLGEVWEDATNKISMGTRRAYCYGHELDSVTNYPFFTAVSEFLLGREDAAMLNHRLAGLRERYPKPMYYALLNLIGSHDTVRAMSVLAGAPDRDALGRIEQAHVRFTPEQLLAGKRRLKIAVLLQMAMPGVPCIYYGDEAGTLGMADPFNRTTYPWGREDTDLLAYYRLICRARSECDALKCGFAAFAAVGRDVFAVARSIEEGRDAFGSSAKDSSALALVNRSEAQQRVSITAELFCEGPDRVTLSGAYRDAVSGASVTVRDDGSLRLTLPPLGGMLLVR